MAQKEKHNCVCGLSESESQLMRELLDTYHGLKMMSRLIRWTFLLVLVFVVDLASLLDNLGRIFSSVKKGIFSLH